MYEQTRTQKYIRTLATVMALVILVGIVVVVGYLISVASGNAKNNRLLVNCIVPSEPNAVPGDQGYHACYEETRQSDRNNTQDVVDNTLNKLRQGGLHIP